MVNRCQAKNDNMVTLGEKILYIRNALGLSQADLAGKLGLKSATVISRYESNKRQPDIDTLVKIAELVNTTLDWLLRGKGPLERTKPSQVAEDRVIYDYSSSIKEDTDIAEIIHILREHPQDKKLVLKLLKGKKDIKEALEGFEVKNLLNEDG